MVVSDQTPRNGEAGIVEVNVDDTVLRPIEEVFLAVVDPALLSGFFISGASGPLEEGRTPRACSKHLNRRQDGPTFCAA